MSDNSSEYDDDPNYPLYAAPEDCSYISFIGVSPGRECGYCSHPCGSAAFYLRAHRLSTKHYQQLIDLGWRRSGKLLYRPNLKRSCCIQYTIRLDAEKFKPTKEQRKALNHWERFVLGDEYIKKAAQLYPKTKEEKRVEKNVFNLEKTLHSPERAYCKVPPEPANKYEVEIVSSEYTDEKFELYKHYQTKVHHDEADNVTASSFRRFLCDSPLLSTSASPAHGGRRLGSFHQTYRLNGQLIALAVLDFLPHAVSGVYFMYHTAFEAYGFGKLSACREASLAKTDGYRYYYMGFYIHTVTKMRYKRTFQPTYFLDPETNAWHLLDNATLALLDTKPYHSPDRPDAEWAFPAYMARRDALRGVDAVDDDDDADADELFAEETASAGLAGSQMPGLLGADELRRTVDLGKVRVWVPRAGQVPARNLVQWRDAEHPVRRAIEEFAMGVGPELALQMELRFS